MLPTVQLFDSKGKVFGLLLLGGAMTAGSGFVTAVPGVDAQIVGWLGLILFGTCTLYALFRLFSRKAMVVLKEDGVEDRRWRIGSIPWGAIEAFEIQTMKTQGGEHRFIGVRLHDEEAYARKVPFHKKASFLLNKSIGFSFFIINFTGLEADTEDTLRVLREYHSAVVGDQPISNGQGSDPGA